MNAKDNLGVAEADKIKRKRTRGQPKEEPKKEEQPKAIGSMTFEKPELKTKRFSILMAQSLYDQVEEQKRLSGARSVNAWITHLIELYLNGDLVEDKR